MINMIRNKKDIPNIEGYEFYGVLADGTIFSNKVTVNNLGQHTCNDFSLMIGWFKDIDVVNPFG